MSRTIVMVIAVVVLVGIAAAAYFILSGDTHTPGNSTGFFTNKPNSPQPAAALAVKTISIGGTSISAEIAATDAERKQGLSGRASLPNGRGMLFVYAKAGNWGVWMKDMRFPIDIIWTDAQGIVIAINTAVSPDTYPTVFYPGLQAQYILEVPAGFATAHRISIGSRMSLPQ